MSVTIVNVGDRLTNELGVDGEIVPTSGHSDDSVSLVLDCGVAFTGDLTPLSLATEEQAPAIVESWRRL